MELLEYTLGGMLEKWAFESPDHEFMIYPDRNLRFTYSRFNPDRHKPLGQLVNPVVKLGISKSQIPVRINHKFMIR